MIGRLPNEEKASAALVIALLGILYSPISRRETSGSKIGVIQLAASERGAEA